MTTSSRDISRQALKSDEAIRALVRAGKEKFALDFPDEQQYFDAASWDVRGLRDRLATQSQVTVFFTQYGTTDQPLPQTYAKVIKSWIILERQSISNMIQKSAAARLLWEAIRMRRGGNPEAFDWSDLCEEDLSQAEILMRERWAQTSTYKVGVQLLVLTDFLAARNVCRPLYYVLQNPRPEDFTRHTIAGQDVKRGKLPSMHALEGVADIYRLHAKDPADRLRAAALAILVVTGFRIGELLTLPLECEVRENYGRVSRYGLRYYKEKARGAEKMFDVRWLTETGAELVQDAVAEIQEITARARERASIQEIRKPISMPPSRSDCSG